MEKNQVSDTGRLAGLFLKKVLTKYGVLNINSTTIYCVFRKKYFFSFFIFILLIFLFFPCLAIKSESEMAKP